MIAGVLRRWFRVSAWSFEAVMGWCVMILMSTPEPGAVTISRLDSAAKLRKGLQVICCWLEKCLGQLLRCVVPLEVVVEVGKRGVRQKLAL